VFGGQGLGVTPAAGVLCGPSLPTASGAFYGLEFRA
jgi:hypothetical protein